MPNPVESRGYFFSVIITIHIDSKHDSTGHEKYRRPILLTVNSVSRLNIKT